MAILKRIKSILSTVWSWIRKIPGIKTIRTKLSAVWDKARKWIPLAVSAIFAAMAGIEHIRRIKAEGREGEAVLRQRTAERKAESAELAMETQEALSKRHQEITKERQAASENITTDKDLYNGTVARWNKEGKE